MRNWLRRRRRWVVALVVASVAASLAVVWWQWPDGGDYTTEDMRIEVDGDEPVELDARLYLPEEVPAPAVLLAHGFGGDKESVAESAEALAERGYVVLTYTARGFGASGGMVHLNSPEHEVADAAGLLDVLAERDDVVQDGPGDPRAAAVGGSYGGALSLLLAGHDERVDAIVPQITWHSLAEALFPNAADSAATAAESGVYKRAWAGLFYAAGLAGGMPDADADADAADQPPPDPEQLAAADPACGRWAPQVCAMYQNIAASGELDEDARTLLHDSSPESILDQITAPTLLIQGQADTLFDLEQADANADGIVNAPVRTAWYSGGHDAMGTPADQDRVDGLTAQWLDRYLLGEGDEPGDSFTFTRIGGVNSSSSDLSTIGMVADQYPGTSGRGESAVLESEEPVEPQQVASPPGGEPAALSALPSMGQLSALAGDGAAQDIPGQFASVDIPSGGTATDVVGAPEAQLRVASETGEAVLFVKLYDVDPSGRAQLPNGLVAPVRLTDLPADIADAEPTTVRLPPIVHRLEAGHSLRLVAATSDQAYAGPVEPAEYTVQMPDEVSLPQTAAQPLPSQDAVWSAALLVLAVGIPVGGFAAWLIARFRHSRRDRGVESEIADVPLTVRDLRKVYQDGFVAVEKVSFSVQRGQVVGLLGPNGAGKTTSLRALMGLLQPTAGQMRVFGRQVAPGAPVLSRLGALVEGPGLLPHLSGLDNLRLFWRATGRPEADARLDEVVDIADLGNRIHRKVRTYSHGMKQRVAVAQAMLGMPDLLVLDEPTDGLDPPQIAEMRRVLHDYTADGRAVLVSSHLLAEVEQTCTHVVVLSRGNVVAAGEVAAVIGTGNGHRLEDAFLELVQ